VQDKAANAANEGAYFPYVTEICKRSQRRKRNCNAILRLHDFIDGLAAGILPAALLFQPNPALRAPLYGFP
jgi:hypothetical protein